MQKSRTIWEIDGFNVEDLLQECGDSLGTLVEFYKRLCASMGLAWDDVSNIDPVRIRVSEEDWIKMCDHMVSFAVDDNERAGLGMTFINKGPGSDADIPVGTIRLLDGWVEEVVRCTCGHCDANDNYFTCASCGRRVPWCFGAADKYPDLCDDCAVKEAT